MLRIGATLSGFERQLLNQLSQANAAAAVNSLRLATGSKVLRPGDDPSAFVQISHIDAQLSAVRRTIPNVEAASNIAAQSQLAIDQIRTQLSSIRAALLTDEDGGLDAATRAQTQLDIDAAIAEIDELAGVQINGRRLLDGSANFRVSGRNNSQIRAVDVYSVGGGSPVVPPQAAQLTYTGAGRKITADANITITGDDGQTTIAVAQDDALTDVADIINQRTATTGVTATADGDELVLRSVDNGRLASLRVAVNSGTFNVSGGAGDGTANGVDQVIASGPAISGRVVEAATQASLAYTGTAGNVSGGDTSTFTLTGKRGAASIATTAGEALTDVRDRINAASHQTGITAAVAGDVLTFTSVDYGTKATIDVNVTSGAFAVSGGNGDGTAQGTNAVAEINGRTITGNTAARAATLIHTELSGQIAADTDLTISGSLGSFNFSFSASDTLSTLASAIAAQSATTGVTASVSADGFDLILEATTQGSSGSVSVEVTDGAFDLQADNGATVTTLVEAAPGTLVYTGTNNAVTADATFDITGEDGTAVGINVTAGQSLVAVANLINAQTGATGVQAEAVDGQLVITSTNTGPDAFADLDVTAGAFTITGGDVGGRDYGEDALTVAAGADAVTNSGAVDGNKVNFRDNALSVTIEFAAGFSGEFSTVSISDDTALKFALTTDPGRITTLGIPGLQSAQLGGASGVLDQLATGGSLSGLDGNVSQAIRVVDEALAQLNLVEGRVDGFADGAVASSAALLSGFEDELEETLTTINGINEQEEQLLLAKNQALAANALSALSVLQQQRSSMVDLIKLLAGLG
ncbi:MAG: flagellin hook IN motif-containing protein [Pirellulaceae bacterium]